MYKKRKSDLMSRKSPTPTALRVADLSQTEPNGFALRPEAEALAQIAEELTLSALRKLSFSGSIKPLGKQDWQLDGKLGATVVQRDIPYLVEMWRQGRLKLEELITARYAFEDINQAIADARQGHVRRNVIVMAR